MTNNKLHLLGSEHVLCYGYCRIHFKKGEYQAFA